MVMVYYRKTIVIKVNKGKKHIGQSPIETNTNFQMFSPSGVGQCLILSEIMCDMYEVLPTREAHPRVDIQNFDGAPT